jgi:hypothetical protein
MKIAVAFRKKVDPESSMWRDVLEATNQPILMKNSLSDITGMEGIPEEDCQESV